jgi:hypothetical protein
LLIDINIYFLKIKNDCVNYMNGESFLHQTKKMHKIKDRIDSQFNNICFIDIQDYSFFDIIYSWALKLNHLTLFVHGLFLRPSIGSMLEYWNTEMQVKTKCTSLVICRCTVWLKTISLHIISQLFLKPPVRLLFLWKDIHHC